MSEKNQEKVEEMEMEMELDGEDVMEEMEELVAEKVKQEEKENKAQKSKRGPKPGNKNKEEKEKKEPKKKELNLKDLNIIQREIKKGRLPAPQGRVEKTDDGYVMKLADGIIFPSDAKYKEVGTTQKMNDGKYILTELAAKELKAEKFKAKHENGEEVEHEFVRVELHKPGREKDVVHLFTVNQAKNHLKELEAKRKRSEEAAKKKAEKEAAEKAEKEKEDKKNKDKEEKVS